MAGKVHCTALVRLLEKLASMQSSLGDQCIIILLGETPGSVQGTCNDTYGLELSSRVTDRIFIDGKRLREEFVADFFESCLVSNFTTHHEQPEGQVSTAGVHPLVQVVDTLVQEAIKSRRLRLPVVIVMLTGLQFTGQAN